MDHGSYGTPRDPALGADPRTATSSNPGRELTRRDLLRYAMAGAGILAIGSPPLTFPALAVGAASTADQFDAEVPTAWFGLALELVRQTPGFSPPVASRAFAYAGVALYESLIPGMPDNLTLAGQLRGLPDLPHTGRSRAFHWPTVANAAMASVLRDLFPTAPAGLRVRVDDLEAWFAGRFGADAPPGIFRRSVDRGQEVAAGVFDWSRDDGGHEGFIRNSSSSYVPPSGPGLWVPTPPAFLPALQPYWGSNRTFAAPSGANPSVGAHTPYSEESGSPFAAEAMEVYEVAGRLSDEQRAIALFWADDPGTTSTPPGHSISILTQVLRAEHSSLAFAAEAYAKMGIAVADAFICCWHAKYAVNLLRPITYVRAHIDPGWTPLVTTPPFPEHPSGHSVQSAAAAHVLTDLFGARSFTDRTHDARGFAPRSFGSFVEAADEAAISRLYGGIHFRPAIELGLDQGTSIGEVVAALRFRT